MFCGRRSCLMVTALYSGLAVRVRTPAGALHFVLGQDTLLSQCLSSLMCINEYLQIYNLGQKYLDILQNYYLFRVPKLFFFTPSPQFNVVNVSLLWKQIWVNCKPHEKTIEQAEEKIKYFIPACTSKHAQKCVISVCFNWFCPRL